jgi:Zn-dependent M28 family amino/carboxypeptidase
MVKITAQAPSEMQATFTEGKFMLTGREDFVIWTDRTDLVVSWNNAEVVFAGYGVVAPEYNWDDYEGLDVKGKIVMILVNDPGFNAGDTSLFKGGKTKDVVVIGADQSDPEDVLKEEVSKVNRVITFDSHPEAGSYYRSDHFNFAKVGVPALYIKVWYKRNR